MNNTILLSVVVVTWNSEEDITQCLSSFYQSTEGIPTEIFVVDNASSDKTVSIVSKSFPETILLRQKKNWGFGEGNNIAIKRASGTYILLLNPDTKVNPLYIQTMMTYLESHPRTGVVGPEQFNSTGDTIFIASRFSLLGCIEFTLEKIVRFLVGKTVILFPWPHKTYMLNAGCILARSNVLPTRKWFDPDCFIYGEEQYLFSRVKKRKWDVYFLRNCSIIHYREKSIAKTGNKWKFVYDSARTHWIKSKIGRHLSFHPH